MNSLTILKKKREGGAGEEVGRRLFRDVNVEYRCGFHYAMEQL